MSSKGRNFSDSLSKTLAELAARIRFAAPPTGSLRWQAPQTPPVDRAAPIQATTFGPECPQNPLSTGHVTTVDPSGSSEDCLYLNVYSPNNVTGPLPVLVWIHGGGYAAGNGQQDLSAIINTNGNGFVGVAIQYRVSFVHLTLSMHFLANKPRARSIWISLL